jgi:glycine/D-amino acid oxidase-like deaminating enzyme
MKILIVGHGIAGSLLAWFLHHNQHLITLISPLERQSASKVAAGVLTPITGKRFAASWEYLRLYHSAVKTYESLADHFHHQFFYPRKTIRVFRSSEEKTLWDKKKKYRTDFLPFIDSENPPRTLPSPWKDPYGSMTLIHGGWCDTEPLLDHLEHFFNENHILHHENFAHSDLTITKNNIHWKGNSFDHVVFCEGYHIRDNPYFQFIPFEHVKGEILNLMINGSIPQDAILNFGKWVIPYPDGSFRCGSTYDWYDLTESTTTTARHSILEYIKLHGDIDPRILGQQAGIRPVCKDMKPVLGRHPEFPRIWVFNGLGAKGILRAPFLANHLVTVMENKTELWSEVNCQRFWKNNKEKKIY